MLEGRRFCFVPPALTSFQSTAILNCNDDGGDDRIKRRSIARQLSKPCKDSSLLIPRVVSI